MANTPLAPYREPISQPRPKKSGDPPEGTINDRWAEYFVALAKEIDIAVTLEGSVELTAQGAAIAATDLSGGALAGGLYRVTYYARITTAAATTSSLTVTLAWTDGGVSPSYSGSAMTGNTTTTVQSGTFMLETDANSPITYATAYASNPAAEMKYKLSLTLEKMPS